MKQQQQPLVIGITGGIGSGKSIVSRLLVRLGYPVYDSDREAKRLMNSSLEIREELQRLFGEEVYQNGVVNRPLLASIIFSNPEALEQVNAIVHPQVRNDFKRWCEQSASAFCFMESAILFEGGFHNHMDRVWCVTAPDEVRIARVVARDKVSPQQVAQRMANQLPEREKALLASAVIVNDNSTPLLPQILPLLRS